MRGRRPRRAEHRLEVASLRRQAETVVENSAPEQVRAAARAVLLLCDDIAARRRRQAMRNTSGGDGGRARDGRRWSGVHRTRGARGHPRRRGRGSTPQGPRSLSARRRCPRSRSASKGTRATSQRRRGGWTVSQSRRTWLPQTAASSTALGASRTASTPFGVAQRPLRRVARLVDVHDRRSPPVISVTKAPHRPSGREVHAARRDQARRPATGERHACGARRPRSVRDPVPVGAYADCRAHRRDAAERDGQPAEGGGYRAAPAAEPRAAVVSADAWAHPGLRAGVLALLAQRRSDAVELDIKDELGIVGWRSESGSRRIGAERDTYDLGAAVKLLHERGAR